MWCLICDGHQAIIGTRRGRSTHAKQIKTSVRFEAVGVTIVLLNVLAHSERDFALCLLLRRHFESHIVTNPGGVGFLHKDVDRKGSGHFQLDSCCFDVWVNPHL